MKLKYVFIVVFILTLFSHIGPCDQALGATIYFSDFERDNGGLSGTLDWEWGVYAFVGASCGTSTYAAPSAYSGSRMWVTKLNDCYSNLGNNEGYDTCDNTNPSNDSILTFTVDLTGVTDAELIWWEWYDLFSDWDWAEIRADGAVIFQHCYSSNWNPTEWVRQTVDISSYTGKVVTIDFHMMASTVVNYTGWYIDNLEVSSTTAITPTVTSTGTRYSPTPVLTATPTMTSTRVPPTASPTNTPATTSTVIPPTVTPRPTPVIPSTGPVSMGLLIIIPVFIPVLLFGKRCLFL